MHDPRVLLDPATDAVRRFARRGFRLDTALVGELLAARTAAAVRGDGARAASKRLSARVRAAADADRAALARRARTLRVEAADADAERDRHDADLTAYLHGLPNLPDDAVPDGASESDARVIRSRSTAAAVVTGAAPPGSSPDPRLRRALVAFLLDRAAGHGYTEVAVPSLLTREDVTASGDLPTHEHDLLAVAGGDLYLTPSGDAALTARCAHRTLPAGDLPLALAAHSPVYRRDAGRGPLGRHECSTVELVRVVHPEESRAELDVLVGHVEAVLCELELAYRVSLRAAGALPFAAATTVDVDVWLPAEGRYRRISSASDHGTFRARRAGIRTRAADGTRGYAATVAAPALPVGEALAALLEQGRCPDGGVRLPDALVPYCGFASFRPA